MILILFKDLRIIEREPRAAPPACCIRTACAQLCFDLDAKLPCSTPRAFVPALCLRTLTRSELRLEPPVQRRRNQGAVEQWPQAASGQKWPQDIPQRATMQGGTPGRVGALWERLGAPLRDEQAQGCPSSPPGPPSPRAEVLCERPAATGHRCLRALCNQNT